MAAYTDSRIRFIHEPRRMDPGTCLNEMLRRARGEYFSYLHTDNRLLPSYVSAFRRALGTHPMALAYCDQYDIDGQGANPVRRRRPPVYSLPRLFSWESLGAPFAATTRLADAVGGFSADDLADDVFFTIRADGRGPRIHVPEALIEYRLHGGSRTEELGFHFVAQSIYRSVIKAYGMRDRSLPDPFAGMLPVIQEHVRLAHAQGRVLASALLARVPAGAGVWIDGTGPPSFWLALGCDVLGRKPLGFRDKEEGTLLGLPIRKVTEPLGALERSIRPRRRRGLDPASLGQDWRQPLRWLLRGLPPRDRALKKYPAATMCSLLVPYHRQHGDGPVSIGGEGPLAAYLAWGVETVACLPVRGFAGGPGVLGLPAIGPPDARCWRLPGSAGAGIGWET
jgi:hypothetical protein